MSSGREDPPSVEEQLKELRAAVLAMAIALGAALPQTPDVVRTLNVLADWIRYGGDHP